MFLPLRLDFPCTSNASIYPYVYRARIHRGAIFLSKAYLYITPATSPATPFSSFFCPVFSFSFSIPFLFILHTTSKALCVVDVVSHVLYSSSSPDGKRRVLACNIQNRIDVIRRLIWQLQSRTQIEEKIWSSHMKRFFKKSWWYMRTVNEDDTIVYVHFLINIRQVFTLFCFFCLINCRCAK